MTLLEAPWRNGKTERAGKDWKEDYYKMTQDGSEAQTWTDFEEDCDAVNQARPSKIYDSGYTAYQRVFGRNPPQMENAILGTRWSRPRVVSWQQAGELTQERSMTMRRLALQSTLALDHKSCRANYMLDNPFGSGERMQPRNQQMLFGTWVVISNTLATVWIACRGSVLKCARSQVRPFHEDDVKTSRNT